MSILQRTKQNILELGKKNRGHWIGYESTVITEMAMNLLKNKGKIKVRTNQRNHSFWLI